MIYQVLYLIAASLAMSANDAGALGTPDGLFAALSHANSATRQSAFSAIMGVQGSKETIRDSVAALEIFTDRRQSRRIALVKLTTTSDVYGVVFVKSGDEWKKTDSFMAPLPASGDPFRSFQVLTTLGVPMILRRLAKSGTNAYEQQLSLGIIDEQGLIREVWSIVETADTLTVSNKMKFRRSAVEAVGPECPYCIVALTATGINRNPSDLRLGQFPPPGTTDIQCEVLEWNAEHIKMERVVAHEARFCWTARGRSRGNK